MARPANPELRAEILKAATKIIEDCGPDCVTMRQVADEVGYSPTTLYLYFKDKHAILREVITDGFADLAGFLGAAAVGPSALDTVRQRNRAYIVWGVMHPGLYQLMFESRIDSDFTLEQQEVASRGMREGGQAIAQAIETGQLKGVADPLTFAMAMWAATHGVASLAISRRLAGADSSPRELLDGATGIEDQLVTALLAGYLT